MNAVMSTDEITLSPEQQALFDIMEKSRQHIFVTGKAGTGKSVLLRHFRNHTRKKVVVAAPTGIAALNVRGQTIHSLFRIAPGFHRKGTLRLNSRCCTILKRVETLIIDEISMVRADLLDAVDERLREAHSNDVPFGGIQVVMFGDLYQLPPVVEEDLLPYFEHMYGGVHFFNASAWEQTEFKIYELSQIFRQKDPIFKDILNVVRDGTVTDEQIEQLNGRHGIDIPAEGVLTLATTNSLVTNINQQRLGRLEGKMYEYRAMITGEMKKATFPTEEVIQLKKEAQVVLLKNDSDKRWVNGTIGYIDDLSEDKISVRVNGTVYDLDTVTWEEIQYTYDPGSHKVREEVVSSFTQYPIRLAWAMTIHKSQGQTYESVALDLTANTFAPGQLYVALSRCTSLGGLYLKLPVKRSHVLVEARVKDFMAKRETIIVETEGTVEGTLSIVEDEPNQQTFLLSEHPQIVDAIQEETQPANQQKLLNLLESTQEESKPAKKKGHPATGNKKAVVPLSLDIAMQSFLESLADNKSRYANNLLIQQSQLEALTGKWYNYVLIRPNGSVFYVGKGTGDRIHQHEKEAKRGVQSYKCNVIRKIWDEGGNIIKQIVAYHDNEEDAYDLEILLISFFGRENLTNCTDGGEGGACEGAGRKPKGRILTTIRLDPDIHEQTKEKVNGFERSDLINIALRKYLAELQNNV